MATAVLPIQSLAVDVQGDAVSLAKEMLKVVASKAGSVVVWAKAHNMNRHLSNLVTKQDELLGMLSQLDETFPEQGFATLATGLSNLVSLTNQMMECAHATPYDTRKVWTDSLEKIAERNRHLDNFVESFQIAADDTCKALLANIAEQVGHEAHRHAVVVQ